mgnify:CR=1 FL=1
MKSDLQGILVSSVGVVLTLVFFGPSLWRAHVLEHALSKKAWEAFGRPAFLAVSGAAFSFLVAVKTLSEVAMIAFWAAASVMLLCLFIVIALVEV